VYGLPGSEWKSRRLVARHERLLLTYAGFFHLACAMLALRAGYAMTSREK